MTIWRRVVRLECSGLGTAYQLEILACGHNGLTLGWKGQSPADTRRCFECESEQQCRS